MVGLEALGSQITRKADVIGRMMSNASMDAGFALAKLSAIAAPMPRDAPVTKATWRS